MNNSRARVGSSFASSGGTVHTLRQFIVHPQYNPNLISNDVAVVRTNLPITYISNAVAAGSIAGTNYVVADNELLMAIGWGYITVSNFCTI